MNTGQVVAVVLPILFLLIVGGLFFLYFVRTRRLVKQITSANPEYLQNGESVPLGRKFMKLPILISD